MNIIAHRKIFYILSVILFLSSLTVLALFGLKLGIDFTGGTLMEVEFQNSRPDVETLGRLIAPLDLGEVRLQPTGERGLLIRLKHIDEPTHQEILSRLGQTLQPPTSPASPARPRLASGEAGEASRGRANLQPLISEKRFDTIGPVIGRELARKSLWAVALVILLIVSYIAWAFRKVSLPVQSWKYGITTVMALVHDVIIPAGFFSVAGRFYGFEVDTLFVTAILTILGFSVHDTIVVFDRIRENLKKSGIGGDFGALVNRSVRQTFVRSINTSLTVVLAMAAVYFFGGATTKIFSLTLIIGVVVGTYSSIFIASPLLVTWHQFQKGKGERVKVKG